MERRIEHAILTLTLLLFWICPLVLFAGPKSPSLKEQLEARYKLTNIVPESNSRFLTIDNGINDPKPQSRDGQSLSAVLTNDDVIKLIQAKLPDSVVVAKIKSSNCNFITNTDALIKLKQAGASEPVLQAILDAAAQPNPPVSSENPSTVSSGREKPRSSSCVEYDACVRNGTTLLEGGQGAGSLIMFQDASQLDPSRGDAWAGMGNAYLQMGQYDDAVGMWDKALELGATLSSSVCHAKAACGDTGDFLLSKKEISFINKKGEKEFAAAPSAVTSEVGSPAVLFGNGRIVAYYFQVQFSGKNYRFYYGPKWLQCRSNFLCSEPGLTQQKIFADYVHGALDRMAAGNFGSRPNKP